MRWSASPATPPETTPTVMEVLAAFIREHSHDPWPPPVEVAPGVFATEENSEESPRPHVKAAITVVGRRDAKHDIRPIDFRGAVLTHVDLSHANLTHTKF